LFPEQREGVPGEIGVVCTKIFRNAFLTEESGGRIASKRAAFFTRGKGPPEEFCFALPLRRVFQGCDIGLQPAGTLISRLAQCSGQIVGGSPVRPDAVSLQVGQPQSEARIPVPSDTLVVEGSDIGR
jgi:hypothetical protein